MEYFVLRAEPYCSNSPRSGGDGERVLHKTQLGAVLYFLSVKNTILVSQPTLTGILLLKDFGG